MIVNRESSKNGKSQRKTKVKEKSGKNKGQGKVREKQRSRKSQANLKTSVNSVVVRESIFQNKFKDKFV